MKQYKNFILRLVNLLVIAAILWQYQSVAAVRAAAVAERKAEIREAEEWNASVIAAQKAAEETEEEETGPADGTYEGTAWGFGDLITVNVTLKDGRITDIAIVSAPGEDKPYYNQSLSVLDEIIAAQSADVDSVSGATLTADGMIDAVADALGKAGFNNGN